MWLSVSGYVPTACLVVMSWIVGANGHGLMIDPVSRNFYAFLHSEYLGQPFWNPQGMNAGGPHVVSNQDQYVWPDGKAGLCGDKYADNPKPFMKPAPIAGTFTAGEIIEVKIILYNNHMGQWRFNLCRATATADTQYQDCMPLKRGDMDEYIYIPPPPKCNCRYASDGRDSGMPSFTDSNLRLETYTGGDQFSGYPVMVTKWKLPDNANCVGCILQWHWITATSCEPPCTEKLDAQCGKRGWDPCGPKANYPEEFWNCADITILPKKRRASRKVLGLNGTDISTTSSIVGPMGSVAITN